MKIGLVYDLKSDYLAEGFTEEQAAEFDSETTIEALESALRELGFETDRIGHGRALCRRLAAGERWDLVFNFAEGVRGRSREAQVPGLLEMFDIPYAMSDALVCALTLDKSMAKRIVRDAGLRTPTFAVVDRIEDLSLDGMSYPLFAKPVAEGTSKGIDGRSKISSPAELAAVVGRLLDAFRQPVLLEEYLPGREFTTGIVGSGREARVVGTTEIRIREGSGTSDYSYGMKEEWERWVEYFPLGEGALRRSVEDLALAVFRLLECRDAARVDIRLDGAGRPSFLEVNPLPGLHPVRSDLPILAAQAGWTYSQLIESIVESALARIDRR